MGVGHAPKFAGFAWRLLRRPLAPVGTVTAWLIGVPLVMLGAPSGALAADFLAWALLTRGRPPEVLASPHPGHLVALAQQFGPH